MPKIAIILAFGSKNDKSINEYILQKIDFMKSEIEVTTNTSTKVDYILPVNGLTEVFSFLMDNCSKYQYIVALGGSYVEGRISAFSKKNIAKNLRLAVIDSQRFEEGRFWFNEETHCKPAGYLAAKISSERNMENVIFIGGAKISVVEKWNKGFVEGVRLFNEEKKSSVKVISEYIGPSSKSFQDKYTAFHLTTDILKWKKPAIIMQVCGLASYGILEAVEYHNIKYQDTEKNDCFIIFTDFNPPRNYSTKEYSYVLFSVVRELDKAIISWVCEASGFKQNIMNSGYEGPLWKRLDSDIYQVLTQPFSEEWNNACQKCSC